MSIWVALGLALGFAAIVLGNLLGGGSVSALVQPVAFLVVGMGTLGAVFVAFPRAELKRALGQGLAALGDRSSNPTSLIGEMTELASVARKEGFLALDAYRGKVTEPLLAHAVKYLMDGFDAPSIRELMDAQITRQLNEDLAASRGWEQAGSYAPTLGVVGAILGLIQTLSQLDDPSKLGAGIAVAFVATLYGLFLSNAILLPIASRMRRLAYDRVLPQEMIKVGVLGIQEGLNPHLVEEKLNKLVPGQG